MSARDTSTPAPTASAAAFAESDRILAAAERIRRAVLHDPAASVGEVLEQLADALEAGSARLAAQQVHTWNQTFENQSIN
jgi:hypothetical protein